ncbi:MAG: 3-deoxy-7-phosphoheptulonate synthase [Acidobacteria bacterium]|nr:3-deoxy-7-phosphoheptulonate synthase [Acidobacteriota bacterium]NIM61008.1 3-deoxy-7-phosphoheptulonate synthase [Acidobacteriota bacterium]NIO59976.1 3-deoxy-7-phosphoheptulonate synthase [Acidobacteriota bacterium]NIQ31048.1 3-deoxy-7-phosphoheptulonate synthase [Acidobacteriota bacterium]NIQ86176.1 3-deoxy-7-phosphoheptulonate synthase [Acidobacteriota bacterium]
MLLFLYPDATEQTGEALLTKLREAGLQGQLVAERPRRVVRLRGAPQSLEWLQGLPGVQHALHALKPFQLALKTSEKHKTTIRVADHSIGSAEPTIIAGPCAVEDPEDLVSVARTLKRNGAHLLRGGVYKPRSSPYDFQGLGREGLELLADAGRTVGLPIVTEAVDERSLEEIEDIAHVVQIGSRNMHNFELLKRAGAGRLPVFLKRGFAATLEEFLLAAEYLLERGNPNVMLCERGIRTFSDHSRFTLDLSIVPRLLELSHLPVFVDPSHASGRRRSVAALAKAAIAAGADGVMVEVHARPDRAMCDGPQSLEPGAFEPLAEQIRLLASVRDGQREAVQ